MTTKPDPIGRHCLICLEDLAGVTSCCVFADRAPAPHDVIVCVTHGSNGQNQFTGREYAGLLERATAALKSGADPVTEYLRQLAVTFNRDFGREWPGGDVVQFLAGQMLVRGIDPDEGLSDDV